jgi:PAS domain S-box-containing protein
MPDLQPPTHAPPRPAPPVAADAVLRAREYGQTLATVVRGLPVGVVTAIPGGLIAFAAPTFAALLGYEHPRSVEGRNIFDLTHPEDRRLDETHAGEVLEGVRAGYTLDKRYLRADGSTIWCTVSATVVRDAAGAPDFAFGVVQDISARKAAEAAAAEALARAEEGRRVLEAVMAHVPEGITIADAPDVRIRMVSAYGAALTGRPSSALEAIPAEVHPDVWDIYHADGVTRAGADELPLTRATVRGDVVKDEEWVLRRPDGAQITVLCNAGPIRDATGRLVGGVIAWRDIDERKRAAAEHSTPATRSWPG